MNISLKNSLMILPVISNVVLLCDVQLRYATIDDLQMLVSVHYRSWHATYDTMLPSAYCAKNSAEHLEKYWLKFFSKHDDRFALIAVDGGMPVGLITAGPIKQQIEQESAWWPCTGYDCELYKLYVLPEYQGRGIGKQLLGIAFEKLYAQGYRKAIVRVFAQNTGAIGFYAHCAGAPLHTAPITYWPEFPYYVYGFSIATADTQGDSVPAILEGASNEVTLQSYESHVNAYIEKTPPQVEGVFKQWIDATLAFVQPHARIIEIGSAFGRDAAYMESKGFTVERTDATHGFVSLLQEQGYAARSFNILTDAFGETYDLVYASAVFLHFTPNEFSEVLTKIYGALSPNGILSFSVKSGIGEEWETTKLGSLRYFCYWNREALAELLRKTGFEILESYESDPFICIIARKNS